MSREGEIVYRIADVEVDSVQGCVRRQGTEMHLRHKTFQVLLYLLEQRHRLPEYERILKLNPNYPLVHFHLAQAYERKGQLEQARTEYNEFLRIWSNADADIPEIILARERLNQIRSA